MTVAADAPAIRLAPASNIALIFLVHHQTGFAIRAIAADGKLLPACRLDDFAGFGEMPAWRPRARASYPPARRSNPDVGMARAR